MSSAWSGRRCSAVREELYVDAARVSGLSDGRIMRRHVLPVVIAPTVIQASQLLGIAIVVQAGLEFLGLGSPNQASWGGMLSDAFQNIYTEPRLLLWPGLAIVLTVTAFSLLGNALRDALGVGEPGPRVRRRAPVAGGRRDGRAAPAAVATRRRTPCSRCRTCGSRYPKADGGESEVVRGVSLDRPARRGARPGRRVRVGQVPDRLRRPRPAARRRRARRRRT